MNITSTSNIARWIRRESSHIFHELNPALRRKTAQWESTNGVNFLQQIGVKKSDIVIDFGCGPGNFCIPAARLVGANGRVYAVDNNPRILKKARRKADALGLRNLRTACNLSILMPLPDGRNCDVALLYDMLHFLSVSERKDLYATLHEVLAENGLLSVYPKHVQDDDPRRNFMAMTTEDVAREIETSGYCLSLRLPVRVWHARNIVDGIVLNFVKRGRMP